MLSNIIKMAFSYHQKIGAHLKKGDVIMKIYAKTEVAIKPGRDMGMITRKSAPNLEHPSISALSSTSIGTSGVSAASRT